MYPRNAASPPRLSIGAVIQISDGAVQTAGVSIVVRPEGGSETAGSGTLSYGATSGIVYYTPTQAETDYTAFAVVAYKTGCIPAEKSVVTSASATAGHAGTDQSKIANPTSTVNLSGTTIKTATDVKTDTQDIQSRLPAALVDGRIVALAQAVTDKTGYKLASDGLALVTAWTVSITGSLSGSVGSVTGNVGGSVGSISGVTFPSNFGALGISGTGYAAAVLHDCQPNSIPEDAFESGAVSARVIADGAIDAGAIAASALNGKGDWLTTLGTNAPANWINSAAITDGALTAAKFAAGSLNGKGDWLTTLGATAPANWINAAAIATDAIDADAIAASAVSELTVNLFKYGDVQMWTSPANQIQVTITKV